MHEGLQSGLSHGIRICQWSCCGSQREYCSSCCCQYRACSTSQFRQQKCLHSILNNAVPGGVCSNENSTIHLAPADPPCTVCADRVSTRQNCSVQQKAIAHNAVIVLLRGFHNVPAAIRRGPALCWRAVAVSHQANLRSALLQNQHLQMACHPGVWARNCAAELNPTPMILWGILRPKPHLRYRTGSETAHWI